MSAEIGSDRGSRRSQRGFVTAETAMVLPALLGVGFTLAFLVVTIGARIRCGDAAWEVARGLARGEPAEFADRTAREFAPAGASVTVRQADGYVIVRISDHVAFGRGSLLPGLTVTDEARVPCEIGAACGTTTAPAVSGSGVEPGLDFESGSGSPP